MIRRVIKYVDIDGNDREDIYWFHMSKLELTEMSLTNESMSDYFQHLIDSKDTKTLFKWFKRIFLASVGKRDEKTNKFVKNKNIRKEFKNSDAMGQLLVELMQDADGAANFFNGILPKELTQSADANTKDN